MEAEPIITTPRIIECQSIRGEWGGICPDCGQRLPGLPKPLGREQAVYVRAGMPKRRRIP